MIYPLVHFTANILGYFSSFLDNEDFDLLVALWE